ncbi:MAG: molybdopterin converting factor [Thermoprotei archaeon]|nr:MAG: molybdopterin converting factor [Thermoprotei archaeon]
MMIKVRVVFLHRAGMLVPPDKRVVLLELPEGSTLKDLLKVISDKVSKRLGEGVLEGRLVLNILVNGVATVNLKHELKDGDVIHFLTPEMGG